MKILQINNFYPVGSTGKITQDIHNSLLKDGYNSSVCYGRGKRINKVNVKKIAPEYIMKLQSLRSRITGYAYAGCSYSTEKLMKIILNNKPDIVHLQCINGCIVNIYKLLNFLKQQEIATVLTLHAEFMYTAGCGYAFECQRWKTGCFDCPQRYTGRPKTWFFDRSYQEWQMMKNSFENFDNLIICPVSKWLEKRAEQSPFLKNKRFCVVENGLDTEIFYLKTVNQLRKKMGINDQEKILLHVTPNFKNPIKGGRFVIELARCMKNEKVKLIIIGFNADENDLPDNIIAIKHTNNQKELAEYYSLADLTILTSQKETFSMVCAESLSCGTPVVGFKAGAPETISLPNYSEFTEYGNTELLKNLIQKWFKKDINKKDIEIEAHKRYAKANMYIKYLDVYKKLL